jgi:putative endonuclease
MPHWTVYLLRCSDGTLYAGSTTDPARRLAEHQAGRGCRYTRARRPVRLVWSQSCRGRAVAQRREAALKAMPRPAKLAWVRARRRLP